MEGTGVYYNSAPLVLGEGSSGLTSPTREFPPSGPPLDRSLTCHWKTASYFTRDGSPLRTGKGDGEVPELALEDLRGHRGVDGGGGADSSAVGERVGGSKADLAHGGDGQDSSEEAGHC